MCDVTCDLLAIQAFPFSNIGKLLIIILLLIYDVLVMFRSCRRLRLCVHDDIFYNVHL